MKKLVMQNGKEITELGQLQDGEVKVYNYYDISDLPEKVDAATGVAIKREVFVEMLRTLAESQKITAIKWMRYATGWGLKESKMFVDSLLEEERAPASAFVKGRHSSMDRRQRSVSSGRRLFH